MCIISLEKSFKIKNLKPVWNPIPFTPVTEFYMIEKPFYSDTIFDANKHLYLALEGSEVKCTSYAKYINKSKSKFILTQYHKLYFCLSGFNNLFTEEHESAGSSRCCKLLKYVLKREKSLCCFSLHCVQLDRKLPNKRGTVVKTIIWLIPF